MADNGPIDLATIGIMLHAESGNLEPLAKHIEAGRPLTPEMRTLAAAVLRGERPKPRSKRTWSQIQIEMRHVRCVRYIQERDACSQHRAIEKYLECERGIQRATLRTYLRNAKARKHD